MPSTGAWFTAVVEIDRCDSGSRGSLIGYSMQVSVMNHELSPGKHTIYHAMVKSVEPLVLEVVEATKIVKIPNSPEGDLPGVKKCCAGMGGIGRAAQFLGSCVRAALDVSPLACNHLRRNFDFPVLCGSVTDDDMLYQLQVASSPVPCVHTVGFPCQPFSRQGDLRGLDDNRVSALWGSLRAMYLCQAKAGTLECVIGAGRHSQLQQILHEFCARMNWRLQGVELELAARWPCHRLRWWAVLGPDSLSFDLAPWTVDDRYKTVGHIIPSWPLWSFHEESQLLFTEEEQRYFSDPSYGADARLLLTTSKAPTFLHSYGHGLLDCPCLCRKRFTESRLVSGGLRGFGIQSEVLKAPRFLHCQEVAFLQTVPASTKFASGRSELVLLGQIAAPLQALWVLHPLLQALAPVEHPLHQKSAETCLTEYVEALFVDRHDSWCWSDTRLDRHVALDCVNLPGSDCSFLRVGPCTASDLLRAESIFLSWGEKAALMDGSRAVPDAALIQSTGFYGPYRLVRKQV